MQKRFSPWGVIVIGGALLCALSARVAHAEGDNWDAWNSFRAQVKYDERLNTDPSGLSRDLGVFLAKNPDLGPTVEPIALSAEAQVKRQLKQDDEALSIYDEGLERYKGQVGSVTLVWAKGDLLFSKNKPAEGAALVEAQLPVLTAAGRSGRGYFYFMTRQTFQGYVPALENMNKGGDVKVGRDRQIAALEKIMLTMPFFLDGGRQNFGAGGFQTGEAFQTGWMYEKLIDTLLASGRADEALKWSALYFRVTQFKDYSVNHATAQLGRAWAGNEDFSAPRIFARAQAAPVAGAAPIANPLLKIALPTQDEAIAAPLRERLAVLLKQQETGGLDDETNRLTSEELITIYLALNSKAYAIEAMDIARGFLKRHSDSPDGALMVCRVFKAVDGNSLRANAFVSYLNGTGDNPLPAFDKEAGDAK